MLTKDRFLCFTVTALLIFSPVTVFCQLIEHNGFPRILPLTSNIVHPNSLTFNYTKNGNPVIAASTMFDVALYSLDGVILPGWSVTFNNPFVGAGPVLGDVDGDGELEIVVALRDRSAKHREFVVLNIDGNEKKNWRKKYDLETGVISSPVLVNLDNDKDNTVEIIFIADSLYVMYGNGEDFPGFPWKIEGEPHFTSGPVSATGDGWEEPVLIWLSNVENKSELNVRSVFSGKNITGFPVRFKKTAYSITPVIIQMEKDWCVVAGYADSIYVFQSNGKIKEGFPFHPFYEMPNRTLQTLSVGDIDGDGQPDLVFNIMDKYLHAVNLDGEYLSGFPFVIGTNGRGEPCAIIRDAVSDSALIFTGSQPDSLWYNELYGLRYNEILEGFPLNFLIRKPNSSVALLPPVNDTLHLVYSTNNGIIDVWDIPIKGRGSSIEWAMEGSSPGGNRIYKVNDHKILDCDQTKFKMESSPVYSSYKSGIASFTVMPESTGEVEVFIYHVNGTLVWYDSCPVWAGYRRRIEWCQLDLDDNPVGCGIYFVKVRGAKTFYRKLIIN